MKHSTYQPDEYELERQHELNRQLERDEEREPRWMHRRPESAARRPRYFSGLMFRPARRYTPKQRAA